MAEGFARALKAGVIDAHSAGTNPHALNHLAVRAMREAGVDISTHTSKTLSDLAHIDFDAVVTVCDSAHESCPTIPGARTVHVGFDDPPRLAKDAASDDDAMPHYRRVRDEIRAFIETLPDSLLERNSRMTNKNTSSTSDIRERVREGYSDIAESGVWLGQNTEESGGTCCSPVVKPRKGLTLKVSSSCCGGDAAASSGGSGGGGCCGPTTLTPDQLAQQIGYSKDELAGLPEGANLGLSCGNPGALPSLKPGDVVLDLGSGAGFDCFLAGPRVGATGSVIGVDMTPKMLDKARNNLAHYRAQTNLDNIEFRLGEIENIPAADSSVDVVISNCVLNLSPDKPRVWREIARVLRSGGRGRVAISDLALKQPLPEGIGAMIDAWIGCIAGASLLGDLEKDAKAAGLVDVTIEEKPSYVETLVSSDDPLYRKIAATLPEGARMSDYIASVNITAQKP